MKFAVVVKVTCDGRTPLCKQYFDVAPSPAVLRHVRSDQVECDLSVQRHMNQI